MASEKHLRRVSQVKPTRPSAMPKRSSSFRRAYNYFFNPETAPTRPPLDRRRHTEPQQNPLEAQPPQSPADQIRRLQKELEQCRQNMEEAREMVVSQDKELSLLEKRHEEREASFKEKEAALKR
jgi:hypothetical protein